jgi:hypothetical protein
MGCSCCAGPTVVLRKHLLLNPSIGFVCFDEFRKPVDGKEHEKDDDDDASHHPDIDANASKEGQCHLDVPFNSLCSFSESFNL